MKKLLSLLLSVVLVLSVVSIASFGNDEIISQPTESNDVIAPDTEHSNEPADDAVVEEPESSDGELLDKDERDEIIKENVVDVDAENIVENTHYEILSDPGTVIREYEGGSCTVKKIVAEEGAPGRYYLEVTGNGPLTYYNASTSNASAPWATSPSDTGRVVIGSGVTSIGDFCFNGIYGIFTLEIKSTTLTSIGKQAFNGCRYLKEVDLSRNTRLTTLGDGAFSNSALKTVKLPSSLTSMGKSCFASCTSLEGIDFLPSSITTYPNRLFYGCSKLTKDNVNIKSTVTTFGNEVFANCKGLTEPVKIPSNVTSLGTSIFADCVNIVSVSSWPTHLTKISDSAFKGCKKLTNDNVSIPSTVSALGNGVFSSCSGLTNVVNIPETVTSIGTGTFSSCNNLTSTSNWPTHIKEIPNSTFKDCKKLVDITFSDQAIKIGNSCFQGCTALTTCTLPDQINELGDSCFQDCSVLSALTLPDRVKKLGNSCFQSCIALTEITVGTSVTFIGNLCFKGCNGLTKCTILGSPRILGDSCFQSCIALKECTISGQVKQLGDSCFQDCNLLEMCSISSSVSKLGNSCFRGCTALTTCTVSSSITYIGDSCFENCANISNDNIKVIVTKLDYVGSRAFAYTGVEAFYIPNRAIFNKKISGIVCIFKGCNFKKNITSSAEENNLKYFSLSDGQLYSTPNFGEPSYPVIVDSEDSILVNGVYSIAKGNQYNDDMDNTWKSKEVLNSCEDTSVLTRIDTGGYVIRGYMISTNNNELSFTPAGPNKTFTFSNGQGNLGRAIGNITLGLFEGDVVPVGTLIEDSAGVMHLRGCITLSNLNLVDQSIATYESGKIKAVKNGHTYGSMSSSTNDCYYFGTSNVETGKVYVAVFKKPEITPHGKKITLGNLDDSVEYSIDGIPSTRTDDEVSFSGLKSNTTYTINAVGKFTDSDGVVRQAHSSFTSKTLESANYATFDTGGADCEIEEIELDGTSRIPRPTNDQVKAKGYKFVDWYKDPDYTSKYDFDTIPEEDTTIYGKFEPIKYKVRFNKTETRASGSMNDLEMKYDEKKVIPNCSFSLTGYHFKNWYVKEGESGKTYYGANCEQKNLTDEENKVVELFAEWEPNNYTIKYDQGDRDSSGKPIVSDIKNCDIDDFETKYENDINISSTRPYCLGYVFRGWQLGSKLYSVNESIPKAKLATGEEGDETATLKAKWDLITPCFVSGMNPKYVLESNKDLSFETKPMIDIVEDVLIDGNSLDPNDYSLNGEYFEEQSESSGESGDIETNSIQTVDSDDIKIFGVMDEGSTLDEDSYKTSLVIKSDVLEKLGTGSHTISVVYSTGKADTSLSVANKPIEPKKDSPTSGKLAAASNSESGSVTSAESGSVTNAKSGLLTGDMMSTIIILLLIALVISGSVIVVIRTKKH